MTRIGFYANRPAKCSIPGTKSVKMVCQIAVEAVGSFCVTIVAMICVSVLLLLLQAGQSSSLPDPPKSPGVYYQSSAKAWVNISKPTISRSKLTGTGLFVETGGFTNLGTDVVCEGEKAQTRIFEARPTLYIRGIGSPEDAQIIRLSKKKGSRTFYKSSANSTIENKIGAKKSDIRRSTVNKLSEGLFSILPDSDLNSGEYLLVIGDPENSYDFGIDGKR
jgi:hypothetical protein